MTFIGLHALQSVPASLQNRDESGQPKTIPYGGTIRQRLSSQSSKRAIRMWLRAQLIPGATWADRTKLMPRQVRELLTATGRDPDAAAAVVATLFNGSSRKTELNVDESGQRTNILLFADSGTDQVLADIADRHWDALAAGDTPPEAARAVRARLAEASAVDLALFGRMLSNVDGATVTAAMAVAHAFTVNPAVIEDDFFTAVDDLADPASDTASSQLGYTALTTGVLYRHAVIDTEQLALNLHGDETLAAAVAAAAIEAFVLAVPAAKRASTAADTLPAVVAAVTGTRQARSYADAYTTALTAAHGPSLIASATARLLDADQRATRLLDDGSSTVWLPVHPEAENALLDGQVDTFGSLKEFTAAAATLIPSGIGR